MSRGDLLLRLEKEFPLVQKPDEASIVVDIDNFYGKYLVADLSQYTGMELPRAGVEKLADKLHLLSADGLRWVMNSYLREAIVSAVQYDTVPEFFIYFISSMKVDVELREGLAQLNPRQISFLGSLFKFWLNDHFWGRYASKDLAVGLSFLEGFTQAKPDV